jgi:hypothetical protein
LIGYEQRQLRYNYHSKYYEATQGNELTIETEDGITAYVSNKTGIELTQIRKRMNEMLQSGLLVRMTWPVRFELTKAGEEYLENPPNETKMEEQALLMAEYVRQRFDSLAGAEVMQEFVAAEQKWEKVGTPDKQKIEDIKKTMGYLEAEIPRLIVTQPKCWVLKEEYEREFSTYNTQVEEAAAHNRSARKLLDDFSFIDEKVTNLQRTIGYLKGLRKKKAHLFDTEQQSHAKNILEKLKMLKQRFTQLDERELEKLEQLQQEFENNDVRLNKIIKRTHIWKPIKKSTIITDPGRIATAESSLESRQPRTKEFVARKKCIRCLKEE